uniref:Uncharacterized protein n=1 Tax=Mycena chlorophos TaxID=658473 RepID=A0ABQ0LU99_MYCCL|nr:predicted protein [Mycena chlorophos]
MNARCDVIWITDDERNPKPAAGGLCPPSAVCGGRGQRNFSCSHLKCQECCHERILADKTHVCILESHVSGPKATRGRKPGKRAAAASSSARLVPNPALSPSPIPAAPKSATPARVQPQLTGPHGRNVTGYFNLPADFVQNSLGSPRAGVGASSARQTQIAEVRLASKVVYVTWYSTLDDPQPRSFTVSAPNLPIFSPETSELLQLNLNIPLRCYSVVVDGVWEGRDVPMVGLVAKQNLFLGPAQLAGLPFIPVEHDVPTATLESPKKKRKLNNIIEVSSDDEQTHPPSSQVSTTPTPTSSPTKGQQPPISNKIFKQYETAVSTGSWKGRLAQLREELLGYKPSRRARVLGRFVFFFSIMASIEAMATFNEPELNAVMDEKILTRHDLLTLANQRRRPDAGATENRRRAGRDHNLTTQTSTKTIVQKIAASEGVPYSLTAMAAGIWDQLGPVERVLKKLVDSGRFQLPPLPEQPPPPPPPPVQVQPPPNPGLKGSGGGDEQPSLLTLNAIVWLRDARTDFKPEKFTETFPLPAAPTLNAKKQYVLNNQIACFTLEEIVAQKIALLDGDTVSVFSNDIDYTGLQVAAFLQLQAKYKRCGKDCPSMCTVPTPPGHKFDHAVFLPGLGRIWQECRDCDDLLLTRVKDKDDVYQLEVCLMRRSAHRINAHAVAVVKKKRGRKTEPAKETKRAKNRTQVELVKEKWAADPIYHKLHGAHYRPDDDEFKYPMSKLFPWCEWLFKANTSTFEDDERVKIDRKTWQTCLGHSPDGWILPALRIGKMRDKFGGAEDVMKENQDALLAYANRDTLSPTAIWPVLAQIYNTSVKPHPSVFNVDEPNRFETE